MKDLYFKTSPKHNRHGKKYIWLEQFLLLFNTLYRKFQAEVQFFCLIELKRLRCTCLELDSYIYPGTFIEKKKGVSLIYMIKTKLKTPLKQ